MPPRWVDSVLQVVAAVVDADVDGICGALPIATALTQHVAFEQHTSCFLSDVCNSD